MLQFVNNSSYEGLFFEEVIYLTAHNCHDALIDDLGPVVELRLYHFGTFVGVDHKSLFEDDLALFRKSAGDVYPAP